MKKIRLAIVGCFLCFFQVVNTLSAYGENLQIVAEVNQVKLTRKDLEEELFKRVGYESQALSEQSLRVILRQIIEQMVSIELVKQAALARQLEVGQYLDTIINADVLPSEDELGEKYQKYLLAVGNARLLKLRQIFFPFNFLSGDGIEERTEKILQAERLAIEVRKQALSSGVDFSALAKEYETKSEVFDYKKLDSEFYGFVSFEQLPKEVSEVVFALKNGEVSPVIKTEVGNRLFKVEAEKFISLSEEELVSARVRIQKELVEEMKEKAFLLHLQELRRKARVIIYLE
jgi:PPIC-type PPIASE domain